MNKNERHRAKRDELVTVFERVTLYVEGHLRQVGWMTAALAACIATAFGVWSWLQARDQAASFLLGRLIQTYRAPVAFAQDETAAPAETTTYSTAEERDAKVVEQADQLLARYGSSKVASKALYYKALALSGQNKQEEAAKVLDEFLRRFPDDFLAPMARYQFGKVRQVQGSPAEALIQFQALVEDRRGFFPREEALLAVGRCQEAMGKKSEAIATYKKIVSDFPNSEYEAEAKTRIAGLS